MPELVTDSATPGEPRHDPFDQKVKSIFWRVAQRESGCSIHWGFGELHDAAHAEFLPFAKRLSSKPDFAFDANELWAEFMGHLFKSYMANQQLFFTGSPRALIIHMLRNAAADLWKRHNKHHDSRGSALEDLPEMVADVEDPLHAAIRAEQKRRMEAVLDDLPFKDQQILRLAGTDSPRHLAPGLGMTAREFSRKVDSARKRFENAWRARYGDKR